MFAVAALPVLALAMSAVAPVAPQPGAHYSNGRTLEFVYVSKDAKSARFVVQPKRCNEGLSIPGTRAAAITGGVLTYSGPGNRVPGLPRPSLSIRGSFATTTTFKWKVTIKVGACKETRSSTLTLGR